MPLGGVAGGDRTRPWNTCPATNGGYHRWESRGLCLDNSGECVFEVRVCQNCREIGFKYMKRNRGEFNSLPKVDEVYEQLKREGYK